MAPNDSTADPLLGLRAILDGVSPEESAILASMATSTVQQALAYRLLSKPNPLPAQAKPDYIPHALDVLIFAALDQDGAMQQAELLAALSNDTYQSRGKDVEVGSSALKKRLARLVDMNVLRSDSRGYAIVQHDAIDIADEAFPN